MIYGIAILSALSISVRGDCIPQCEPIPEPFNASLSTNNARPFENALLIARCYSICAVAQVWLQNKTQSPNKIFVGRLPNRQFTIMCVLQTLCYWGSVFSYGFYSLSIVPSICYLSFCTCLTVYVINRWFFI